MAGMEVLTSRSGYDISLCCVCGLPEECSLLGRCQLENSTWGFSSKQFTTTQSQALWTLLYITKWVMAWGVIFSYANIVSHTSHYDALTWNWRERKKRKWKYSGWSWLLAAAGGGVLGWCVALLLQQEQPVHHYYHTQQEPVGPALSWKNIRGVVRKSLLPPCSYYVHGGQFTVFHAHKVRFTHEPDGSTQVDLKYCNTGQPF